MATRGHYIFNNKTIIYNHWDNYPEGAVILLNNMLLQDSERRTDWAARFLRANPSAELTNGEFYGGAEYNYYINSQTGQIRVMSVNWDEEADKESESVFFEGSIYDFINEYFPQSAEVGQLPEYKRDTFIKLNAWKDGESLAKLGNDLKNQIEWFAQCCTLTKDNSNRNDKQIQATIGKMLNFNE